MPLLLVADHTVAREGAKHVLAASGQGWPEQRGDSGFATLEDLRCETFDLVIVDLSLMTRAKRRCRTHSRAPGTLFRPR